MAGRSRRLLQGAGGKSLHSTSRGTGGSVARVLVGRVTRVQQSRPARFVCGKKGNRRAGGQFEHTGSAATDSASGRIAGQPRPQHSGSARLRGRVSGGLWFLKLLDFLVEENSQELSAIKIVIGW